MAFELADREDIAWAAGLFEGEGSITYSKYGLKQYPYLKLSMLDEEVVRRFDEIVGVGNVYLDQRPDKLFYAWICSRLYTKEVLEVFWPFLSQRRKDRAIELGVAPKAVPL